MSHETTTPLRVLVIDDSRTIRRTAETLLRREGFDVECANDGFEALPKMMEFKPDIVFVDIMMPRLDGYQTCALIKNNSIFKSIPVVMLSSKDGLFDKAKGRIVGASFYVTKPFTKDELLSALRTACPEKFLQPLVSTSSPEFTPTDLSLVDPITVQPE